jgi:hypothetical protein
VRNNRRIGRCELKANDGVFFGQAQFGRFAYRLPGFVINFNEIEPRLIRKVIQLKILCFDFK